MKERVCVVLGLACAMALVAAGCGGGDDDSGGSGSGASGNGGGSAGNGGGSAGNGGGGSCDSFQACGGDLSGTWQIDDVCLEPSLSDSPDCADLVKSAQAQPTGTVTFGDGGALTSSASFTVSLSLLMTDKCARALGEANGLSEMVCTNFETLFTTDGSSTASCMLGADGCACEVHSSSMIPASGMYSVQGNTLTSDLFDSNGPADYCVSGSSLTIRGSDETGVGTLVLHRQ